MSATDRARFPQQTRYLAPGGAGITSMREQYGRWLQILMTITGVVLLIVCANLANLMLIRGLERRRQTSLSMALGAPVLRVLREPLIESILLSMLGGAAGLAVAFAGTRLILQFAFRSVTGVAGVPISASPSVSVLLFAFVTSLLTGLAFSGAPAWIATRVDPMGALRGANRSTVRAGSLSRKALVTLQAALSLVLLSAAGLLHHGFRAVGASRFWIRAGRANPGEPKCPACRLPDRAAPGALPRDSRCDHERSRRVLRGSVPVRTAPLGLGLRRLCGRPSRSAARREQRLCMGARDGRILRGRRPPLLSGRGITDQDTAASRKIAVVNEAFARRFFGTGNPIGKHFGDTPGASREFEIVGVTRDARYFTHGPGRPAGPMYFLPEAQADYTRTNVGSLFLHTIVVRTKPGANVPAAAIGQAVAWVDPNLPIISMGALREQIANQFTQQRLIARLTRSSAFSRLCWPLDWALWRRRL